MAHRRFKKSLSYAVIVVLITISLGIEWLSYSILSWTSWPSFHGVSRDAMKILLVADPQLLGEQTSMRSILGSLERWDADRFIRRTFMYSYQHIKPHVVIFLGDIFNEGKTAKDEEFVRYVKRFLNVFRGLDFNSAFFTCGDDDVGDKFPLPEHIRRFEFYFGNYTFLSRQFLDIIKVNASANPSEIGYIPPVGRGRIRVAISHMPLTLSPGNVLSLVQPHLVFSTYLHTSVHIVLERKTNLHLQLDPFWAKETKTNYKITLMDQHIHEMMVPTCSYWMGTKRIGYGVAVIEPNGFMLYTVLWLPSRLMQLGIYFVFLCLMALAVFYANHP